MQTLLVTKEDEDDNDEENEGENDVESEDEDAKQTLTPSTRTFDFQTPSRQQNDITVNPKTLKPKTTTHHLDLTVLNPTKKIT